MAVAYEVGSVFRIVDEASAVLQRIAAQLRELDGALVKAKEGMTALASTRFTGLTDRIAAVNAEMTKTANVAARTSNEMVAGFGRASAELQETAGKMTLALGTAFSQLQDGSVAAIASLRGIKDEMAALSGEMKAAGVLSLPGPGGGGGGGRSIRGGSGEGEGERRGRLHFGRMGAPLPGGSHLSIPGGPVLAAAATAGYGIYLESEFEDQAARMFLTGQIDTPQGMTKDARFKQIRDTLQRISSLTGYSPKEAGEAMLAVERQFGGLPLDKRVQVEESLAPYAGSEARLKETGFAESFQALVGLAHMTGTYDPKKLPELARSFSYASLITPATITQLETALSYSMPLLHAGLDMDPSSIMFLTAMMQTAGIKSTKSGTWLRSFFENAEPRIGTSKSDLAHNEALHRMGLLDASGKPSWRRDGPDGKVDWDKSILTLSDAINKFTKSTPVDERLGIIKQAFGERGGGFAALMNLDEFIKQFAVLQEKMRSFQGGADALDYLAKNSPMQQVRQTWADFQNLLMDIGKVALPSVSGAIQDIDKGLRDSKAQFDATVAAINTFVSALAKLPAAIGAAAAAIGSGFAKALTGGLPSAIPKGVDGIPAPYNPGASMAPHIVVPKPHASLETNNRFASLVPPAPSTSAAYRTADVYMDHQKVGKIVERGIAMNNRSVNTAAGFDGRSDWAPPDVAFA